MASLHSSWFYTALHSVQLDFVSSTDLYFHTAPDFVWHLSHNSWFYTICNTDLLGYFHTAPGFVWFLMIGF